MGVPYEALKGQLTSLRATLEKAFSPDTAAAGFEGVTPSTGQCAAASLVVYELLGGDLVSAKVQGQSHWFNRIYVEEQVLDVDVTGDQFGLPGLQMAEANALYADSRVRNSTEANPETIARAIRLAERANVEPAARGLRELLSRNSPRVLG